jgi:hypothetical protein
VDREEVIMRSLAIVLAVGLPVLTPSLPAHADEPVAEPPPPAATVRGSRVPDYIALGVTGGLAVATIGAFWHRHTLTERLVADNWQNVDFDEHQAVKNDSARWLTTSLVLFGTTVVSAAVTTALFTRHHAPAFGVQVTGDGAAVSLGGGF